MPHRDLAHLSDEAVVALTARSDEVALAELYDRYGRAAYGLALRVLRDEALAEDAVQEAFLADLAGRLALHPRAREGEHLDHDARPPARRRPRPPRGAPPRRSAARDRARRRASPRPPTTAWLRLERERVQAALRQLPDQQREAIELAYYGGFTQSELAERLGEPLGTIKSRMFAGLARLRELLDNSIDERFMDTETIHELTRRLRARRARARRAGGVRGAPRRRASAAARRSRLQRQSPPSSPSPRAPASPPPALRGRILDAARAERPNVVPLRARRATPLRAVAAVAAVAACVAIGLGIWNVSLHNQLSSAKTPGAARGSRSRGASGSLIVSSERLGGARALPRSAAAPAGQDLRGLGDPGHEGAGPAGLFHGGTGRDLRPARALGAEGRRRRGDGRAGGRLAEPDEEAVRRLDARLEPPLRLLAVPGTACRRQFARSPYVQEIWPFLGRFSSPGDS